MKTIISSILILGFLQILISCNKNNDTSEVTGNIEFYLLESFKTKPNSFEIIEDSIKIENSPLIKYSEIISYNSSDYSYLITENGKNRINNLTLSTNGLAFVVLADDKLVYTGYFWHSTSSSICDWIVVDPVFVNMKNEMQIKLGYPGSIQEMSIPDKRNDKLIIDILKRDNKLVE